MQKVNTKKGGDLDASTEEKIKSAARLVFQKKGFAATRTRDIAEKANINLALLNYYFRSKEKLFDLIMLEAIQAFLQNMGSVFNDETTSLYMKVELFAERYIDILIKEPEMPIFIMSEIRGHGAAILEKLPVAKGILQTPFIKQYNTAVAKGEILEPNPIQFLMNLLGLVVLPFISSPLIKKVGNLSDQQFTKLMQERKKMIPIWIKAIFSAS